MPKRTVTKSAYHVGYITCSLTTSGNVLSLADQSRVLLEGRSSQFYDNTYIWATSVDVGES